MAKTGKITDLQALRVITHPLRVRIYELLTAEGPATATQLSQRVGVPSNSLSYHMRQLANHGYVEEATELQSDGRERWWRAVPGGVRWSPQDFPESPGARAILSAAERAITSRRMQRLHDWQSRGQQQWGAAWVDAALSSDSLLFLAPDELRAFGSELEALFERWTQRSRRARKARANSDTPGTPRAPVFAYYHAFPFTDDPT